MNMQKVKSSNINEVGYDDEKQELHVKFKGGKFLYVFKDVPKDVFDGLIAAASIGKVFSRYIKDRYLFDKREIEEDIVDVNLESGIAH